MTDGLVEERGTAENPSDVLETGSKDAAEDDAASTGEKADDKKKAAKKTENTSNVSSAKDMSKAKAANNSAAETSGEAQDRPSQPKEEITNDSDGSEPHHQYGKVGTLCAADSLRSSRGTALCLQ